MGYIDNLASMVFCGSRLGIYSMGGQGYRDNGDYLHWGGALEYPFVFWVARAIGTVATICIVVVPWSI